jgi:hypothetical protein
MITAIHNWLNAQPAWIQEAAVRLLTNRKITDAGVTDLANLVKTPPASFGPRQYPQVGAAGTGGRTRIESLGNIIGIDDLCPSTPLKFGAKNLTIVYGNNGTGKSGYVRIIKKVAGKAGSEDLKPNIFKPVPAPGTAKCAVAYSVAGNLNQQDWLANGAPIPDLLSIDVFDSKSGQFYLNGESEISYIPEELALFAELVTTAQRVEKHLRAEAALLAKALPLMPPQFSGTAAANVYSGLRPTTQPSQLALLFPWTEEDAKAKNELAERLKTADLAASAKQCRQTKAEVDQIVASLKAGSNACSDAAIEAMTRVASNSRQKRKDAIDGAKALTASAALEGVGGDTWRALWEAARAYSTAAAYDAEPFPHITDGAKCVLCHQEMDAAARKRMQDFENYISGKLEADAKQAERTHDQAIQAVPLAPSDTAVTTACAAAGIEEALARKVEAAWLELRPILGKLSSKDNFGDLSPAAASVNELIVELEASGAALASKASKLEEDARSFDRETAKKELTELEAKEWTSQQEVAIKTEIQRLEKLAQYDIWCRATNTAHLTKKGSDLSEALITEAYIKRFNDELTKLGASRLRVELVKSRAVRGRTMHHIRLRGTATVSALPSQILSEGEARMVSLAAFLADVGGKAAESPFVFDDPISSLDQGYEEKVADRLVELSRTRQVIVFTHRLSLYGYLMDSSDSDDVCISLTGAGSGQPHQTSFFAKNPKQSLKDILRARLPTAEAAFKQHDIDTYTALAKGICGDIRILVERSVEKVLLDEIVLRNRNNILTNKKIHKLSAITREDCAMIETYMGKYSYYVHSQSDETPVTLPSPDEIRADINALVTWMDSLKARFDAAS